MKGDLTPNQKAALRALESALAKCSKEGVDLCGMDGNLYYATTQCLKHYNPLLNDQLGYNTSSDYHPIAQVQNLNYDDNENGGLWAGTVKSKNAYKESGGW